MKLRISTILILTLLLLFIASCDNGTAEDVSSSFSSSIPTNDEASVGFEESLQHSTDDMTQDEISEDEESSLPLPESQDSAPESSVSESESSLPESSESESSEPESSESESSESESSEPQSSEPENSEPENSEHPEDESEVIITIPMDSVQTSDITESGKELHAYGALNNENELLNRLSKELVEYEGKISLIVWSTDGSKALSYNTKERFFTASTIKIAYVLSCCVQIDEGKFDKDTKLTYEEKHHHGGGGEIKDQPFGTEYTIEELINKCISISDNVAYEMLVDHFGYDYYNNMMEALGCNSITLPKGKLWSRKALTKDFLIIWNELYEYFDSGAPMAEILKNSCTNTVCSYGTQTLNRRKIDYSHKEGDNYGAYPAYNDSGIIWDEIPYVFVIFSNSDSLEGDKKTMTDVMNAVFDIMGTPRLHKEDE